jgi:transcriptional regulator GlxA family with amidase domain
LANQLSHRKLYCWQILSKDGRPLATSDGLEIGVHRSIDTLRMSGLSRLIVCGGSYCKVQDNLLIKWLHRVANQGTDLGAISTGSYLLAAAGLLDGYRCTTHWQYVQGMREEHPRLQISSQLFVIDRNRFTCSGGSSVLDLMMHIVSRDHGDRLAALLSESLVCERVRAPDEPQRVPLRSMLGHSQPRLAEAIALMEANIEEPIPLAELACYIGVSARHLERLFRKHLDCSPSRHYRELRLKHAHCLLWQTGKTVTEIAFASGFNSIPHFCKNFREYFGHSPSISRRLFNTKVQGARA